MCGSRDESYTGHSVVASVRQTPEGSGFGGKGQFRAFSYFVEAMTQKKQLRKEQALEYHSKGRPGKIEVVPTKEAKTQRDLSLAYSPGVADPCKEIHTPALG